VTSGAKLGPTLSYWAPSLHSDHCAAAAAVGRPLDVYINMNINDISSISEMRMVSECCRQRRRAGGGGNYRGTVFPEFQLVKEFFVEWFFLQIQNFKLGFFLFSENFRVKFEFSIFGA